MTASSIDHLGLDLPRFEPGWVWLCGAGPGDPGLLTLHAVNGLRQADVLVYDALVGPEILGLARPDALLEYAGKRGGKPSPRQRDISLRIVELAKAGKRVLRLKGGDPFVFGRGGEEALSLVEAGVPFRVLPGISAGIGGLAYAGIPCTHRETNSVVTFLTGHDATGATPDGIDWAAVARGSPVIVMYMALKHLDEIRRRLLAGGRAAAEPMAIVSHASLPEQQVVETTLGTCVEDAAAGGATAPAMIVLGEVVRLRSALDWLGAIRARAGERAGA
ncbi:uroporphyrinogen-III C-methyltransferase [Tistlia consotensis]|uniref:uroporphyrinogen-III C-methyltransferase n=1 Tax=Tistlia consotensis USBA 355 TaxID=560819 RepID=A0A1Y6BA48_9PROT|nr:uroporphyrinogen-III C-methyltransferase [Tistlia consotensis]SME92949.1 uroporphyrinogen-III C-methyltransferase [Tistlia consotensis USBA 355]SNR28357.1 uroporphyrinogen-III C-methyltransferase [Tistlia consotensis]